jgi:uncharacterized protein YutE (UPF0331/DUF86 family)
METEFNKEKFGNMTNPEKIKGNILFFSTFVLLYESFEDMSIQYVKELFSEETLKQNKDGTYITVWKVKEEMADEYREKIIERIIHKKPNKIENSIKWLEENNKISNGDFDTFEKIRNQRNYYVHELDKQLAIGVSESDADSFVELVSLYNKINELHSEKNNVKGVLTVSIAYMMVSNLLTIDELKNVFKKYGWA